MCISVPLCDERLDYGYICNIATWDKADFRDELSCSVLTELYDLAKKDKFTIESRIARFGYDSKKYFYATCSLVGV